MISRDEITSFVVEAIKQNSNQTVEDIDISKELHVYIATSIEFIKLIVDIEEQYDFSFSNEELAEKSQCLVKELINDICDKKA